MKTTVLVASICLFSSLAFGQKQALFLTTATPTAGDNAVSARLTALGFVVTRVTDTASQSSDANGKDLIVVSSSVSSGNISTKFTASPVPLINGEQAIYDELGIDANNVGGATQGGQTQINIVDCTHPLAAGLSAGVATVLTASGNLVTLGTPVASAQIVATLIDGSGRPTIFGIEAGAALNPVRIANAPARRVGFFWEANTFMTPDGLKLFDAAVAWATATPTPPTDPIGITSNPASITVQELALATFTVGFTGAAPVSVQWQRSDGLGGFTNISGATCPTLVIGPTTPSDNGAMFSAVVNNGFSSATSSAATLTVLTDTTPPAFVLAIGGGVPPTSFDLTYSEPVNTSEGADPFNYSLGNGASVLSAILDVDQRTVHFTCDPITNGTVLSLVSGVHDRAFTPNALNPGDPGSSIAIITTDGSIRRHRYNTGAGVLVSDLTNNFRFPNFPDEVTFPTLFEDPTPTGDEDNNLGVQLVGYVTAPVSGSYHFYMSSDDAGVLFLSTDESPANKRLIASEPLFNGSRDWTGTTRRNPAAPENRSTTLFPSGIPLVAGQRYFIEALMKEGGGGNFLAVAWQKPGDPIPVNSSSPIPGLYLSRYNVPVSVPPAQPADITTLDFRQVTFTVNPSGSPQLLIQWYENDVAIPGANARSFTTPLLTTADSGKSYFAIVMNDFSAVTSRVATLTVNADNVSPVLVSAAALNSTSVGLCFDEALDAASAQNPANYTISGGAVSVTSAVLRYDLNTVALTLSGPVTSGFTVTVNNVTDLSTRNAIAPSSSAAGNVAGLTAADIGTLGDPLTPGSSFTCREGEFELIAGGSDVWGNADHGHFAFQQITGNFDKRVKVARIDDTDASAKGGLMVRESLDAASRNLHAVVMPPPPANPPFTVVGRNTYETGTRAATGGATAGWGIAGGANGNLPANHPGSWIRLRRIGTIWKAYVSSNGMDWVQNGQSEQLYPDAVFFLLEATAHINDGRTNRVLFQALSDTAIPGASVAITQQPQNTSIDANHIASFSVIAAASGVASSEIAYQWQRSDGAGGFTNINAIGANGTSLNVFASLADDGAQYRVVVSVPGAGVISSAALLTVTNDVTPPRLLSAIRSCVNLSAVTVTFSELLETNTATDLFNYDLSDTSGNIFITGITLQADGRSVVLNLATPLANNAASVLTVHDVADLAGIPVPAGSKVLVGFTGGRLAVGLQNLVVIEAENYDTTVAQGGKDWLFFSNPAGSGTFSGTGYMRALPETGAAINEPGHLTQSPRLDYCVNFPVAGTWFVWLRGNDIGGGANSVHVGIDNTDSADLNDNRIGNSGGTTGWGDGTWRWTRDADVNTRIAFVTVATPGLHTFNIWMREDSVIVDKLLLTTSPSFVLSPNTILGPNESPREVVSLPPVALAISQSGGMVTVSWTPAVGTLQHADDVTGPWTNVNAATNPYSVNSSDAKQFYRVLVQ